jgi:hypothetical protein
MIVRQETMQSGDAFQRRLTHFYIIDTFARDCALTLAHLVLPTLTCLHVDIKSHDQQGEDMLLVIPYIARNVSVLHDIEQIRSVVIGDKGQSTEILTWTTPGADSDVEVCSPAAAVLDDTSCSAACFMFAAQAYDKWDSGVPTAILMPF